MNEKQQAVIDLMNKFEAFVEAKDPDSADKDQLVKILRELNSLTNELVNALEQLTQAEYMAVYLSDEF